MPITPHDWSVVIVGQWNPAILTPSGIARRLFKLDQGTPVDVAIALDTIAPPRVTHEKITVLAGKERLIIQLDQPSYPQLVIAMQTGVSALQNLPETPLVAVGITVRFSADSQIEALRAVTSNSEFDNRLSDQNLVICGRALTRVLDWEAGKLNIAIEEDQSGSFEILFNFELRSTDASQHIRWLQTEITKIENKVSCLLYNCLNIEQEA